MAQIAVVGTGYVGLTTGAHLAHLGHAVVCADVVESKVAMLNEGRIPIVETGLDGVDWSEEQKVSYADDHRHGWSVHMERIGELLGVASE